MNSILFLCIFLCYGNLLYAQVEPAQRKIEIQRKALHGARQDTSGVRQVLQLGNLFLEASADSPILLDSAKKHAKDAEQRSALLGFAQGKARSWLLLSSILRAGGDIKQSDSYASKVRDIFLKSKTNSLLADSYVQLGDNIADREKMSDLEIDYYKKAIEIYKINGMKRKQASALVKLGNVYLMGGEYQTMIELLTRAREIYDSVQYPEKEMDLELLYERFEYAYLGKDNYTVALKYALASVRIIEKHKDSSMRAFRIYNNVALLNSLLKRYDTQDYFLKKALPIARRYEKQHNDSTMVAQVLGNMIVSKIEQGKPNEAIAYLKRIGDRYPHNNLGWRHFINTNYLQAYTESKKFKLAKHYFNLVNAQTRELDSYHAHQTTNYNAMIKYLIATGQLTMAGQYVKINDIICKKNSQADLRARNYLQWYKIDSIRGDFRSALEHFQLSKTISDSLTSTEKAARLADLQMSYQTEKKDEEIKSNGQKIFLLNKQAQYQKVSLLHEKTIKEFTYAGILMLLVVLALIYNRYRVKQRTNRVLEEKQERIDMANISLQKMNESLQKLLGEKEWLLKEIHHRVKNNLQIVISLLNTQSAYLDNEDALNAIKNSQHRMHAMSLIHQKLYQSENLASIDMSVYVRELIEYLGDSLSERKNVTMSLDLSPIMLDVSQAVPLGLIINEAVSNSIKYAFKNVQKGMISISLIHANDGSYALNISDNGPGLPADFDLFETNSLGMSLMYGLTQQLEGDFLLSSEVGLSITVIFEVRKILV